MNNDLYLSFKPKLTIKNQINQNDVVSFLNLIFELFYSEGYQKEKFLGVYKLLLKIVRKLNIKNPEKVTNLFLDKLAKINDLLYQDVKAFHQNDPACLSEEEVVLAYPGFYALFCYRIAHELYLSDIKIFARLIAFYAYQVSGVDIHPAAIIGNACMIDHGSGVVIGETVEIGNNVKIYQGVTLGALTTKDAGSLKGVKRHPTIKDNVTIYANATILGGNTIIEEGAVIKANAFIV